MSMEFHGSCFNVISRIRERRKAIKYESQIRSLIAMYGGKLVSFIYDAATFGNMIVLFNDRVGKMHEVVLDRDSITYGSKYLVTNIDPTSEHGKGRFLALLKAIEQIIDI